MTPQNRERAYEKRRYEQWQGKLTSKQAQTLRTRRRLALAGVAITVVLLVVAVFLLVNEGDDDEATPAAGSSPTASATAPSSSTCPPVEVAAPQNPQQFDKVPDKGLAQNRSWTLTMATTCGDIVVELDGKAAPQAVSSMIQLARDGFYDGSPCHRLTTAERFEVLQCGDPTGTGTGSPGYSYGPIENAPADQVYPEGTVAMARAGGDGESMGSQFFLVYGDTDIPDDPAGGYTVLGTITEGLDVVKQIAEGGVSGGLQDGSPVSAVSITSTEVAEAAG